MIMASPFGRPVRRVEDSPPATAGNSIPTRSNTGAHLRRRRTDGPLLLALAALAWLLGSPTRAEAYCANVAQAKNLRIFQYNVHGMPPRWGDLSANEDVYQISDEARMKAIADEILADDPDIVTLNEVWQEDEGGKGTFIKKLAKRYPFSIRYVRGLGSWPIPSRSLNDAGLMLFSKDPFIKFSQPVPTDAFGYYGFEACNGSACADWGPLHAPDEVAVHTYDWGPPVQFNGDDKHAQKAVMMVRLQGACPYVVAFTHSDADEELEDQDARKAQLAVIKDLINASLTTAQKDREPIFLTGDLNVDGNAAPEPHQQLLYGDGSGSTEYGVQFDGDDPNASPSAAFYDCGQPAGLGKCQLSTSGKLFTDSWGAETSPTDFGQTNHGTVGAAFDFNFVDNAGQRLDYIFHSNPVGAEGSIPFLCMQHITRDFKLVDPARSDHMAIRADFNGSFPRCNAREKASDENPLGPANGAEPVEFDPSGNKTFSDLSTQLRFPGSNQWYIVKDAGTFAVAVTDSIHLSTKIGAAVYHHSDLSREIVGFHKETSTWVPDFPEAQPVTAIKYQLDDPPYLVRVYGMVNATLPPTDENFHKADRTFPSGGSGQAYKVSFHMSRCASFDDSCSLSAGAVRNMVWPDQALNADDMAYFTFYTDAARSTTFNAITFPELNLFVEPLLADQAQAFDTADVHLFKSTYDKTKGDCIAGPPPCNEEIPGAFATWSSWIDDEGEVGFEETRGKLVEGTLPPATPGTPQKWLLKLGRPDPDPDTGFTAFTERLRYETTLTYFLPDAGNKAMTCHIQQSFMYDDQIGLKVFTDSGNPRWDCDQASCPELAVTSPGPTSYVGQFDEEGTPRPLGSTFAGPYNEFVLPSLYEDVLNGSDFEYLIYAKNTFSSTDPLFNPFPSPWEDDAKILPLDPTEGGDAVSSKARVFHWCGEEGGNNVPANESIPYPIWNCKNAEFWYTMGYQLSHDDLRK